MTDFPKLPLCLNCGGVKIRWNNEEVKYLRERYGKISSGIIARGLGRSEGAIYKKAPRLGLKSFLRSTSPRWTSREKSFIRDKYGRLTTIEIANELGRTVGAVTSEAHILGLSNYENRKIHKHTKKFDSSPTPHLAYITGVYFGDGYTAENPKIGKYQIGMNTIDKIFAESFKRELKTIGLSSWIWRRQLNEPRKDKWVVTACSKDLCFWLNSLTLDQVYEFLQTAQMKTEFIRGFYESDGSFDSKRMYLRISNTNHNLLKVVKTILEDLNYSPRLYGPYIKKRENRKPISELHIGKKEEASRFLLEINPIIKRGT